MTFSRFAVLILRAQVQLALLTATVKLFIRRPTAGQDLVPKVLKLATEEVDNPDLRDRVRRADPSPSPSDAVLTQLHTLRAICTGACCRPIPLQRATLCLPTSRPSRQRPIAWTRACLTR